MPLVGLPVPKKVSLAGSLTCNAVDRELVIMKAGDHRRRRYCPDAAIAAFHLPRPAFAQSKVADDLHFLRIGSF